MRERFSNNFQLVKHILKREWLNTTIWLIIIIGLTLVVAVVFNDLYSSPDARLGMAQTMQNPAMVAMVGPVYSLDNYTNGVMYAGMMLLFSILAVAVMNIFLIIRYTRKDEENHRLEVIRSLPVGRLSNLSSTIIVCFLVNLILALMAGGGLYILNITSMNLGSSLLYGACLGVSGMFFGSIAALFSQICSSSKMAVLSSLIFLGATYLIRAIGDVSQDYLSYISPLGLIMKSEVFAHNYWWPIIILLSGSIIVLIISFYLNSIRDLGSGLIAAKPGRTSASSFFQTYFGLTLKLLKTTLIGWGSSVLFLGVAYGAVFGDLEKFLEGSELMQQMFLNNEAFTFAEQFMTTLMVIAAILITIPTLIVVLKIHHEEKKGRLEPIYAKKISRKRILGNYLIFSFLTSIIMMLLFVMGLWMGEYYAMKEPISFLVILSSGMSFLPAIWFMIGSCALLISFFPKLSKLIWLFLGFSFFIVYLGKLLNVPDWLVKLVPFGLIPKIPVETFNLWPLIVLIILTITMLIISFWGYNNRDIGVNN